MKNNWSYTVARKYIKKYKNLGYSKDLALRVYTSRLLGKNNELVYMEEEIPRSKHQLKIWMAKNVTFYV